MEVGVLGDDVAVAGGERSFQTIGEKRYRNQVVIVHVIDLITAAVAIGHDIGAGIESKRDGILGRSNQLPHGNSVVGRVGRDDVGMDGSRVVLRADRDFGIEAIGVRVACRRVLRDTHDGIGRDYIAIDIEGYQLHQHLILLVVAV